MDITLHWHRTSGTHRTLTDSALAFKKQLGHQSNALDTQMSFTSMPKKINLKWKERLAHLMSGTRFRSDTPCVVYVGTLRFEISGQRTAKDMANRIANLVLRTRHDSKNKLGMTANEVKQAVKL
jgi:hypothetical protein